MALPAFSRVQITPTLPVLEDEVEVAHSGLTQRTIYANCETCTGIRYVVPELDEFPVDGRDEEFFETYPSGIFSNIEVSPATLPNGTVGTNYAQQLTATGGTAPYVFSLMGGAFPAGISLLGDTLAGTPSAAGSSSFSIQVVDANGHVAVVPFTLVVDAE